MSRRSTCTHALACLVVFLAGSPARAEPSSPTFEIRFHEKVSAEPFTGRVYLLLSKSKGDALPAGPNWFRPEPFFALDVNGWKPGEALTFDDTALGYPAKLAGLPAGKYYATAVMDFDRGGRSFARAEGNGHSRPVPVEVAPNGPPVRLTVDQVHRDTPFAETDRVKLVDIPSRLLSDFHGRPTRMQAAVVLPESYEQDPAKKYPVVYVVPGFGGDHTGALAAVGRNPTDVGGVEMLYVVLNPDCRWGHHVFADSDNNGPCGTALCTELIPHIEKTFRAIGRPGARFLTGHSSGGWSSLWLQVAYPDFFGGTWSTAPDPVDFRDFQRVNIYLPGNNIFFHRDGTRRPLGRRGDKVVLEFQPFSDMEHVMGHGGQLGSFEAVFGPKGPDGRPVPLWDRRTGAIDPEVAESWKRYDIGLVLRQKWLVLGPKLAGKIHVYMGSKDNFYLEGAVLLLQQTLADLGSDAVVELFPGKDHSSLMTSSLRARIAREMAEQFRRTTVAKPAPEPAQ